ncbi:MAG: DEAD/DEAH box helicase [Candidatus Omnitrophica bacterium]|nr:DEAD/DEAH box helicase [Candidatus Omnitrophota bacterium]
MISYDPFQAQAIRTIDAETSLLVAAPTGAGKTLIAE